MELRAAGGRWRHERNDCQECWGVAAQREQVARQEQRRPDNRRQLRQGIQPAMAVYGMLWRCLSHPERVKPLVKCYD